MCNPRFIVYMYYCLYVLYYDIYTLYLIVHVDGRPNKIKSNQTDIDHQSPLGKSDHSVLSLRVNCYLSVNTYARHKTYYNKANYEEIRNELNKIDWNTTLDVEDINQQWEVFLTKMKE